MTKAAGGNAAGPGNFLGNLTDQERAALAERSTRRRYRKGATVFWEGDPSDVVIVIVSGLLKLSRFTPDGREALLALAGPGELVGELSAIDGEPRSATAVAISAVEAFGLPGEAFTRFVEEHPRVSVVLLRTITRRLREADRRQTSLGTADVLARVSGLLLELADGFGQPAGDEVRVPLPISQTELASWVGSSREAVVKALRTLRSQGCIETARGEVRIQDADRLAKYASA